MLRADRYTMTRCRTNAVPAGRSRQASRDAARRCFMPTDKPSPDEGARPEQWLEAHGDALYRYALIRTGDAESAEDLVQECLVAALGAWPKFDGRSSVRTWLVGILKHKLIDRHRQTTRETAVDADSDELTALSERNFFSKSGKWKGMTSNWRGAPAEMLEKGEFWDVLRRCLAALPAPVAKAFHLRELDQLASEEVCKVLDLTPTNLWTRLYRARLALQQCLDRHWFGRGPRR